MFFAETLGPVLTADTERALFKFVKTRIGGASVTPEELRATVSEFLRTSALRATPEAAIDLLARAGHLSFQAPTAAAGARFEVAA